MRHFIHLVVTALSFMCVLATLSAEALPAMLSLGGTNPGEPTATVTGAADVLYAADRSGREVQLAKVGIWHGLDLRDLGLPFVADDGTVLFGGAIMSRGRLRWKLFAASPDRASLRTIELPESLAIRADPRPVVGSDGAVVFSVTDPREALYRFDHGKLVCLLKAGQRLNDGQIVHAFAIGSIDVMNGEMIALITYLGHDKQAELLLSHHRTYIAATQDGSTPDGGRFVHLGWPAIDARNGVTTIIFTAQTTHGYALYEFSGGNLHRVLAAGTSCPAGLVNFLSEDRVGVDNRGIVVEAGCSGQSKRLLIGSDRKISIDSSEAGSSAPSILNVKTDSTHSIVSSSLSVNHNGQAAYLGSPSYGEPALTPMKLQEK